VGEVTSTPLTCPACSGTGGGQLTWTSDGTSLEAPPWVEEAQRAARCAACGGSGMVYYLFTPTMLPLQGDVLSQLLDVRVVSGCATCPLSHEPVVGISTNGCCRLAEMRYFADSDFVGNELVAIPSVAPDWCPLRKGTVTLNLKEGS
jgi:hypothetical protein